MTNLIPLLHQQIDEFWRRRFRAAQIVSQNDSATSAGFAVLDLSNRIAEEDELGPPVTAEPILHSNGHGQDILLQKICKSSLN